jgi:hypothetical protein
MMVQAEADDDENSLQFLFFFFRRMKIRFPDGKLLFIFSVYFFFRNNYDCLENIIIAASSRVSRDETHQLPN